MIEHDSLKVDEDFDEEQLLLNPAPEPSVDPQETFFQCWKCVFKSLDKQEFYEHFVNTHGSLNPFSQPSTPNLRADRDSGPLNGIQKDVLRPEHSRSKWVAMFASGNRCVDCGMYYPDILKHLSQFHLNLSNVEPVKESQVPSSSSVIEYVVKEDSKDEDEETFVVIEEEVAEDKILSQKSSFKLIKSSESEDIKQFRIDQLNEEIGVTEDQQPIIITMIGDQEEVPRKAKRTSKSQTSFQAERERNRQFSSHKLEDGRKVFSCNLCKFETKFGGTIHDHINAIHKKIKHKCTECNFETLYLKTLTYHRTKKHGVRALTCSVPNCKFKTIIEEKLLSHLKSKHQVQQ